jgi:plasmid stabilization system protein ParE
MKAYRLTPKAEDDFFTIWTYIAADNPDAADRLETELFHACQRIADKPDLGHCRRDLTEKPVRFFLVRGTYLIVYDPASEPLEVIRVLHGARDVARHLEIE